MNNANSFLFNKQWLQLSAYIIHICRNDDTGIHRLCPFENTPPQRNKIAKFDGHYFYELSMKDANVLSPTYVSDPDKHTDV